MTFENWWNENSEKYIKDIDLLQNGCFSHCTDSRITDAAADIVDHVYDQPDTDMINTTMIFIQYLYEKYKLEPMDCEILGQLIIVGLNMQTKLTAESICKTMLGGDFDIEKMLSEITSDSKQTQKKPGNIISISTDLTPEGRALRKSLIKSKKAHNNQLDNKSRDYVCKFIDDFINRYFGPRFEVGMVTCRLIMLYDEDRKHAIDKCNCVPYYLPRAINGKLFAYSVIDVIDVTFRGIMSRSKCTAALQDIIEKYRYEPNDPCTWERLEHELNDRLTTYINSPAMFYCMNGLRNKISRTVTNEMITRLGI